MQKKVLILIGWIVFCLLATATLAMYIFAAEYTVFNRWMLAASSILILVLLTLDRKRFITFLKTSFFRNALNNSITIFLTLCILGLINYLAYKNSKDFDLTEKKLHSLSAQSRKVVSNLRGKIEIELFAKRQDWQNYLNLLRQYQQVNKNIKVKAIDVEANPAIVKLNNIQEDGSIVIKYQDKRVVGKADSELKITNLLLKLIRSKKLTILYTKGHGEVNFNDTGREGGSYLLDRLREFNYNVAPLDLLAVTDIPRSVDAIMMMGPVNGLMDLEVDKLKRYLNKGGNLLVTLAPNFHNKDWKSIYSLLNDYGIEAVNSIVLDRLATVQGSQATIPLITNFNTSHSITRNFSARVIFPLVSALKLKDADDFTTSWIAQTSNFPASWGETNLKEVTSGKAQFDDKDLKGPITVAAVSGHHKNFSKVAVIGSSSLVVNGYQSQSSNFNFFINTLAWLMDDEGIIAINRPQLTQQRIFLGSSQITLIFWISIIFIPFIFFTLGIYFYRRKLKK
jgi:ABC-type uncharacterized transport system involved in gliding motility auxiliary subunit